MGPSFAVSRDGTRIAYTRRGAGPALILVGGGLDDGTENEPLATALAEHLTTYNYARRGRGRSGDTQPYDVARELEDIAALIAEAGGRAHLLGVSSGAMFALEAARAGLAIDRLAIYDVPYDTSDGAAERVATYRAELDAALAEGRRGDAVALFMRLAGASDEQIAAARTSPHWPGVETLAHTLAYDAALYGPPPVERLAAIATPTVVVTGGAGGYFGSAGDAVAAALPHAERVTLAGQGHVVDPAAIVPVLADFLGSTAPPG